MSINLFDVLFVIIIIAFALLSYLRGAVKELLTLFGLIGGFVVATHYAPALADELDPLLQDSNAAELLAFVLLVLVGYFIGVFLSGFGDMFRRSPESSLSQFLGGVVGFVKGITVSLVLLWVVRVYVPAFQDEMTDSTIGSWLGSLLSYLERIDVI